jgi:hypothetical protein
MECQSHDETKEHDSPRINVTPCGLQIRAVLITICLMSPPRSSRSDTTYDGRIIALYAHPVRQPHTVSEMDLAGFIHPQAFP